MRFLLHGNLTPAVDEALKRHGHTPVRLDPSPASADELFKEATKQQLDVVTGDHALVSAPFEHEVKFNRSIVFLQLEGADVEQDDAIDRLFERYKRLSAGRVYTVTATRVKIRQLPGV